MTLFLQQFIELKSNPAGHMIVEEKNRLAVPAKLLYEGLRLVSYENYKKQVLRGHIIRLKDGRGPGNTALVDFESLPFEWKQAIALKYPNPKSTAETKSFSQYIEQDTEALAYFSAWRNDAGDPLPGKLVKRHTNEASIFNAFTRKLAGARKYASAGATTRGFWTRAARVLDGLHQEWPHKLPKSEKRLKDKYNRYMEDGYKTLLKGWNNQNSRVVNADIENLLNSLFCQRFKPTAVQVLADYQGFLDGTVDICDAKTGELFEKEDFEPISESTVRNYLNKWENQVVTHKKRSNKKIQYGARHRAYADLVVDHAGSIFSLDDRDLPWKMHNGKRPIAYIAADVCSQAFVGWAFSKPPTREDDPVHGKNHRLIQNMFQNMFQQLDHYEVNMPAEVEVEHHLMWDLRETTLLEGNLFNYVRFAAPENPQEKKIEALFNQLRYQFDKRQNDGLGWLPRPKARSEANEGSVESAKPHTYDYEEIVEMAIDSMIKWNAAPHPDQKKFPGMSRLDVFIDNQNPKLQPMDWRKIARWVGHRRETSVNRYEIRVNNAKWMLPDPKLANRTGNSGAPLDAYWLENAEGVTDRIYLYAKDSDKFLCEAIPKKVAHRARIEQTEEDLKVLGAHYRYNKKIENHVKEGKERLVPVKVLKTSIIDQDIDQTVEIVDTPQQDDEFDFAKMDRTSEPRNLLDEL